MAQILKQNKFILSTIVITIVLAGMTFGNIPAPAMPQGLQTVNGTTFNFANYPSLTHEQIAIINYFDNLITSQAYNLWDGWHAENYLWALQYINAFLSYVFACVSEVNSGYRSSFYENFAQTQIMRMNTTIDEYGNDSMEYYEWASIPGFTEYYYPNATNPDANDVYTGGFRGPANIMWTGHYALMMALYERNFNSGRFDEELTHYIVDWKNSTTTDRLGTPKAGGLWGTGLIPCEPYVVFPQCNSIPIYTTELYDNLYSTDYMESGMWDYGLDFIESNITDENDLYVNGYFVQEPMGWGPNSNLLPQKIPGQSVDHLTGGPSLSSYCNAWTLTFLEYTTPDITIPKYSQFIDLYGREISGDVMYMLGSYDHPSSFGDIFGILGTVFTTVLANQRGDHVTRDRLLNLLGSMLNKVWSPDGRQMHYDGSPFDAFLSPIFSGFSVWSTLPVTMRDLADSRSAEFWNYPYISAADDDNIWVYQAQWDPSKSGFILNIRVDQTADISFSNFNDTPTAYSQGVSIGSLTASGSDYILTLQPGIYQIVILEGV
jgi:hypothetical protein